MVLAVTSRRQIKSALDTTNVTVAAHLADYAQDTGVANAYKITLSPAPTSYEIGKIYKFKATNANTGASIFQIGALTATTIKKNVSQDLETGDIPAGAIIPVVYDGTYFQLIPVNVIKPVDYGRYQAQFGFDGTESYSNAGLNNGIVDLDHSYSTLNLIGSPSTSVATVKLGMKIHVLVALDSISVTLNSLCTATKFYLLDSSKNALAQASISSGKGTISYSLAASTDYYVVVDAVGSTQYTYVDYTSATYPINGSQFNITAGYNGSSDMVSDGYNFSAITSAIQTTSGTVTKTNTPSDLKKYGNLKWTQTTPAAGSSVVCDICDGSINTIDSTVPIMTSNTTPIGVASASSENDVSQAAWKAFDGLTITKWEASVTTVGWLRYNFASSKIINKYDIVSAPLGYEDRAPKTWTFEGSNNGTSWTVLDAESNQPVWTTLEKRTFNFVNNTPYNYYRLNVSACIGTTALDIVSLGMYQAEVILKSNVTSIADLSDIDPIAYPSIKERWTLSRLATTDASPTLDVDSISVTWEGAGAGVRFATGSYTDSSTTIAPTTLYTKMIPLSFAAKKGKVIIANQGTAVGLIAHFDTVPNDTICLSFPNTNYGYVYGGLNRLSTSLSAQCLGYASNSIALHDAYISGSNLILGFWNINTASQLYIQVLWEVEG